MSRKDQVRVPCRVSRGRERPYFGLCPPMGSAQIGGRWGLEVEGLHIERRHCVRRFQRPQLPLIAIVVGARCEEGQYYFNMTKSCLSTHLPYDEPIYYKKFNKNFGNHDLGSTEGVTRFKIVLLTFFKLQEICYERRCPRLRSHHN